MEELKPCPIKEVYERFKHMDKLFCDPLIRQEGKDDFDPFYRSMFYMWDAIKEYNQSKGVNNV